MGQKIDYKVAIIGRANVGKSTLFNRLGETHKALVSAEPHTTRDRKYLELSWQGLNFEIIDTGGVELTNKDLIAKEIKEQVDFAIKEADLLLFLVDSQVGIIADDRRLFKLIQNSHKPFLLVANKADNQKLRQEADVFQKLANNKILKISALNGSGTGDLLDEIIKILKNPALTKAGIKKIDQTVPTLIKPLKIAIVGKPNVGKSSLINAILGEKRIIVSEVAFTTREAIDIPFQYKDEAFLFIDTAGLRRKRKVANGLEKAGASQSRESIRQADIVLLMTDVSDPLSAQDKMISAEIQEGSASIVILANKWDLIKKTDEKTIIKYRHYYQTLFPFLAWAPIIFVSALNKKGMKQILELILKIKVERQKEISENALSKFLKSTIKKFKPRGKSNRGVNLGMVKMRRPFIHHLQQIKTNPPVFSLKIDGKVGLDYAYLKYLEKSLREKFGFIATPIKIQIEK